MESATRLDGIAARLARDEIVAAQFLDQHRRSVHPPRHEVVRAAEDYRQWCSDARSTLLRTVVENPNPIDLDAFEQQWRASADVSEIHGPAGWAELGLVLVRLALLMCGVLALIGHYVAAVVVAAVAIAAYFMVRKAKPTLLVGPAGLTRRSGDTGALRPLNAYPGSHETHTGVG